MMRNRTSEIMNYTIYTPSAVKLKETILDCVAAKADANDKCITYYIDKIIIE